MQTAYWVAAGLRNRSKSGSRLSISCTWPRRAPWARAFPRGRCALLDPESDRMGRRDRRRGRPTRTVPAQPGPGPLGPSESLQPFRVGQRAGGGGAACRGPVAHRPGSLGGADPSRSRAGDRGRSARASPRGALVRPRRTAATVTRIWSGPSSESKRRHSARAGGRGAPGAGQIRFAGRASGRLAAAHPGGAVQGQQARDEVEEAAHLRPAGPRRRRRGSAASRRVP